MQEKLKPPIGSELFKKQLEKAIEKARSNAIPLSEYNEKIEELRKLRKKRINGLLPEQEKKYQILNDEIMALEVFVPSVMEFKKLLELLNMSPEQINTTLNHENAHANKAEELETKIFDGFRVRFYKDENGEIRFKKSVKATTDFSFPREQILKEDIMVNEAPLHAGDRPSKRDKESIEKIKDELSKL